MSDVKDEAGGEVIDVAERFDLRRYFRFNTRIQSIHYDDASSLRTLMLGTGSTGIQIVPEIARQAGQLFVFQRTANVVLPAGNCVLDDDEVRAYKADYPNKRRPSQLVDAAYAALRSSAAQLERLAHRAVNDPRHAPSKKET